MRYYLFASHGKFAEGILHSVELIMGKQKNIWTLCAYTDQQRDLRTQITEILARLSENDELIVITDIFGGSVNNEFMSLLEDNRIYIIAGLNLPLVIELLTADIQEKHTVKLIKKAIMNSRNSIKYCNPELENNYEDDEF